MLKQTTLKDPLVKGDVMFTGDKSKLIDVFGSLDDFEFWCNIVTRCWQALLGGAPASPDSRLPAHF